MKKEKHWEAVYYTGSTWGNYGEQVVDRHCGHKHKNMTLAEKCWDKNEDLYNGVKEYND
ncbi:MAG: hypothetical protein WC332_00980 [Clostridia bacterium]|jgi:hypothetical protein